MWWFKRAVWSWERVQWSIVWTGMVWVWKSCARRVDSRAAWGSGLVSWWLGVGMLRRWLARVMSWEGVGCAKVAVRVGGWGGRVRKSGKKFKRGRRLSMRVSER